MRKLCRHLFVLTLTALWVIGTQAKEARLAFVTARAFHILLTPTLTSNHAHSGIVMPITHTTIYRAIWITITC